MAQGWGRGGGGGVHLQRASPLLQNGKIQIGIRFHLNDIGHVLHELFQAFVVSHVAFAARRHLCGDARLLVAVGGGRGEEQKRKEGGGG